MKSVRQYLNETVANSSIGAVRLDNCNQLRIEALESLILRVQRDTIENVTEECMGLAEGYWLDEESLPEMIIKEDKIVGVRDRLIRGL